jgi:hypothetical protein
VTALDAERYAKARALLMELVQLYPTDRDLVGGRVCACCRFTTRHGGIFEVGRKHTDDCLYARIKAFVETVEGLA